MKLISRFTAISGLIAFQFLLIFPQSPLWAQGKYIPHSFKIGTDVFALGTTFFGEDRERYELNTDLAIHKYFLVADFGVDNIDLTEETFDYSNDGYYFRVGADVNFMPTDEDNNVIFFGVRYARSYFNDKLAWNGEGQFPLYDVPLITSSNSKLRGRWFELAVGMKVNIWKELFVGYTVHYKFARNLEGEGVLTPYEMPGYGVYESEKRVGFSYQVFWRIPFRKNPLIPVEEITIE